MPTEGRRPSPETPSMYDPFAPPPVPGQMQTTAVPSGVMPLSPNNALAPTMMPPQGQIHPDNVGRMGPGGVVRQSPGQLLASDPTVQAMMAQRPGQGAFQLAMRNAPDEAAKLAISNQWNDQLNQWHQSLSAARQQYHQQQNPNWQPTNPIQVTPFTTTFDPSVTAGPAAQGANTQFPLNPQAPTPQTPGTQTPPSPPTNDWRALRTPKPSSYGI